MKKAEATHLMLTELKGLDAAAAQKTLLIDIALSLAELVDEVRFLSGRPRPFYDQEASD